MMWNSVKDGLPKQGTEVFLMMRNYGNYEISDYKYYAYSRNIMCHDSERLKNSIKSFGAVWLHDEDGYYSEIEISENDYWADARDIKNFIVKDFLNSIKK